MKYTLVDYFSYFFLRNATNFSNIRNTSFWFRSSWLQRVKICEISGSRRGVDEIRALLGYYAAYVGSFLTYVSKNDIGTIFKGQGIDIWPETLVNNYKHTGRDNAEQRMPC